MLFDRAISYAFLAEVGRLMDDVREIGGFAEVEGF
jgi:hypothetical protein